MIRLKSWQWFILATPLITIIAFFAIAFADFITNCYD